MELRERDRGDVAVGRRVELEELARREALARQQRFREHLDAGVVVLDVRVVDPAGGLDLVLELRQLGLEALEVLRSAELSALSAAARSSRVSAAMASERAAVTLVSVSRS